MTLATVIIGIGNPVLTDDSVGIEVVKRLEKELRADEDVVTRMLCAGGMRLMEALQGYQDAIIIDAIVTDGGEPGSVYYLEPSDLRQTRHTCSTHDANLADALELGKSLGLPLPEHIQIWAIEASDVVTFSEHLTDPVQAAVPKVVQALVRQFEKKRRLARRFQAET